MKTILLTLVLLAAQITVSLQEAAPLDDAETTHVVTVSGECYVANYHPTAINVEIVVECMEGVTEPDENAIIDSCIDQIQLPANEGMTPLYAGMVVSGLSPDTDYVTNVTVSEWVGENFVVVSTWHTSWKTRNFEE